MKSTLISEWSWVWYPCVVVGVVVFSLNYIFVSSSLWQDLKNKREHVESQAEIAQRLKTKLNELSLFDQNTSLTNLKTLNSVIPLNKQVLVLLNQLQTAAAETQVKLMAYQSTVGDISTASASQVFLLSADFSVPDLASTQRLIAAIEKKSPLIEIHEAQWEPGKVKLIVEGVWAALPKLDFDINTPLPAQEVKFENLVPKMNALTPFILTEEPRYPDTGTNATPF